MKGPEIYIQTTPTTCGIACAMMVMNKASSLALTSTTEAALLRDLRLDGLNLVPAFRLATLMAKAGIAVRVRHQGAQSFWDFAIRAFSVRTVRELRLAESESRSAGVEFSSEVVDPESVAIEIAMSRWVIHGVLLGTGIKHAVLIYARMPGGFEANDPLTGRRFIPDGELASIAQMDTGRWYMSCAIPAGRQ